MEKRTCWKLMLLAATSCVAVGCSTNSSSAPFHMYSSPLLDGEMAPPHVAGHAHGSDQGSNAGVQPRQVYTYQRYRPSDDLSEPGRRIRPGEPQRPGPRLDTVDAPARPVLASYRPDEATGSGRALNEDGASSEPAQKAPSRTSEDVGDGDRASNSAGFIYALLSVNEVELSEEAADSIPEIYRACRADGEIYHSNRPNIGDLVFFHNTFDANEDGRNNDWYTQVGMIERVHTNGTVDFLSFHNGSVQRLHLNLDDVDRQNSSNSRLRSESSDDPPFTQYLAGQLFAGYCNILGDREDLTVIDNWAPGVSLDE